MSFMETVRRIEAERLLEAKAAIAAGWTEADHPAKCCPAGPTTKGPARTHEQRAQYARTRAVNAEHRASDARIKFARIHLSDGGPNDRAQANIPWSRKRSTAVERVITAITEQIHLQRVIEYNESRAKYWRAQERKWS